MLQYSANLLKGDPGKPLHKLLDLSAIFQVLEKGSHRHPGARENPGATDSLGVSLYRRAGAPVDHWKILSNVFQAMRLAGIFLCHIEAMGGGELEIVARFPDGVVKISNFADLREPTTMKG